MSPPGQPLRTQPTRFDYIGQWLVDHHQLGVVDRSEVIQAVFVKPRALGDPRLRQAGHDLAAEVLSGKLPLPRMQRYVGPIIIAMGLAALTAGLVMHVIGRGGAPQLILGILVIAGGVATSWWAPKQMGHNVERALQLNRTDDQSAS